MLCIYLNEPQSADFGFVCQYYSPLHHLGVHITQYHFNNHITQFHCIVFTHDFIFYL